MKTIPLTQGKVALVDDADFERLSKFKWHYDKNSNKASITFLSIFGQRVYLTIGRFSVEKEAAEAYDEAARKHFGEFAALNFPREGERSCLEG